MSTRGNERLISAFLAASLALAVSAALGQDVAPKQGVWTRAKGLVLRGDIVTMDAARTVIPGGSLFVRDGKIVAIARAGQPLPPEAAGVPVVDTRGVIAPGLIDAHNHLEYDFIRMWDVPAKYNDMYEWMGSKLYEKAIKYPKRMLSTDLDLTTEIGKYAEVKAIVGGTTSVQGAPADSGYTKHFVRNIDFSNFGKDKVRQRSIGIMDLRWRQTDVPGILDQIKAGKVNAWMVHLAEGTNEKARSEFDDLEKLGLLNSACVIIHGIALGPPELAKMAKVGAKLISSPLDNYLLYGRTADLVAAKKAGVTIALGSDWSPYGSKNVLAELKFVREVNRRDWGNAFSDRELVEMVTVNAARAVGWDGLAGQLAPGMAADVTVFDKTNRNPYTSIVTAGEVNVQLVLIDGEPLYGDRAVMERLKGSDCETIFEAGGRKKAVDITTKDTTVPKGTQTFADVRTVLEKALKMEPDWLYDHSIKKSVMTREEFKAYLAKTYKLGLDPAVLDPVYATGDSHYFETIRRSKNGKLDFDLSRYYGGPGITSAVTPRPTP